MAILNKDQFFESIKKQIGTDSSQETIQFLEDMTDTYNSMEKQIAGDGVNWKQKCEELDKSWEEKYRSRFFSNPVTPDSILYGGEEDKTTNPGNISINDLFVEIKE